ncbi:15454_t:CDS:2, partial [Dentiscutata erythropus]
NPGPYEFGELPKTKNIEGKNQHTKKWKELTKDIEDQILSKDQILIKYNSEIKTLTATTKGIEDIYNAFQNKNKKPTYLRCWKSCNIYIYGTPRTGKSYLAQILFPDAYNKSNEDGKWYPKFNKNNEHDVVIYNEFSGSDYKFQRVLNLLDRREFSVQYKGGNINYAPKVQVFTANSSLREQYIYYEDMPYFQYSNEYKVPNKKFYSAISERFDFIIEYFKFRDDNKQPCNEECLCCKVRRIFHQGSYDDFINLKFDIEFGGDITIEKAEEIVYFDNGNILFKDERKEIIFFRKNFGSDITQYILSNHEIINGNHTDIIQYPRVVKKLILKNQPIEYKEIIFNRKNSSLKSDDSSYTKKKKKGKFRAVNNSDTENLKADIEQARIQRNYEELNKNNIKQDIITNEDLQEDFQEEIVDNSDTENLKADIEQARIQKNYEKLNILEEKIYH